MITKGNKPGQLRNQELNGGVPDKWVRLTPKVIEFAFEKKPLVPLYAVISSWFDSDIIEACVKNCIANGVSKIFLLDNASPDNTVEVAKAAGVTEVKSYETEFYDDDLRTKLQNEIVERITKEERLPELWWLVLDADEFPSKYSDMTVQEVCTHMSHKVKIIGSNFIDLYPSGDEVYESGKQPSECFSKGVWRRGGITRYCQCGHWKHSLVRYQNGIYDAAFFRGNHGLAFNEPKRTTYAPNEPNLTMVYFHAPIRAKEHTFNRLKALCESGRSQWDDHVTHNNGAIKRWKMLEKIYAQDWRKVELPHTQIFGRDVVGLTLYPWKVLLK